MRKQACIICVWACLAYSVLSLLPPEAMVSGVVESDAAYVTYRAAATTNYNFYFGNLHSHTSYSDGVQTPADAFEYARDVAGIDFLAVTDHCGKLTEAEYADILYQADVYTEAGVFVGIGGQEWTGLGWCHCNIFEADHVFRVPLNDYDSLYNELFISGCTANFNHPWPGCFDDHVYSAIGDVGINAVEVRNEQEQARYVELLNNGWHVGTDGSEDNHTATWGSYDQQTVALACSLTKADILDAMWKHRTYSTLDRNARLAFQADGHWMGDTLSCVGNIPFSITLDDPNASDHIEYIELYQNGRPISWLTTGDSYCSWRPEITPPNGDNYYFVKVCQADGDRMWSSPIWIDCTTDLPETPMVCYPADQTTISTLTPTFVWHTSDIADRYILQYSTADSCQADSLTVTIGDIIDTTYTVIDGLEDETYYHWRVCAANDSGASTYSGIRSFFIDTDALFCGDSEIRLTTDESRDRCPSILQTSTEIWLVWSSGRHIQAEELYYRTSSDSGESWSDDIRLTDSKGRDASPAIAEDMDGKIWVTWMSKRDGPWDIHYKVYNGTSWSADSNLTRNPYADMHPAIIQTSDGLMWVIWGSDIPGGSYDVCYMTFDGNSWSPRTRLTDGVLFDLYPDIVQLSNADLWVVWSANIDGVHGQLEVYYMIFDGTSWSDAMRLTDSPENKVYPSITQTSDGHVWVTYDKGGDIFYRVFADDTWSDESMLPGGFSSQERPSVTQSSDGRIWIAYNTVRNANEDVYAQRSKCTVTAAVEATDNAPAFAGFTLFQNHPNPFDLKTTVEFALREDCHVELTIYSILGRKVRTLIKGRMDEGKHVVFWDGKNDRALDVPSGVYFCRLRIGEFYSVKKLVLLE